MSSFEDSIKKDFSFLFDKYHCVFSEDNVIQNELPHHAVTILQGQGFCLRFIKDRVDFFLDLSILEKPYEWLDIYKVLSWLKRNSYIEEDIKPLHTSEAIKRVLQRYLDLISKVFEQKKYNLDIFHSR